MNDRELIAIARTIWGTSDASGPPTPAETARLVEAVSTLSDRLNHDRTIVRERYLDDPTLLAGYAAFFLPRSVHQISSVLAELDRPVRSVVDVGSGPGSATLAALAAGASNVLAIDHAQTALDLIDRITPDTVRTQVADLEVTDVAALVRSAGADTVIASHVVNELWTTSATPTESRAQWCMSLLDALGPDGRLVLLDPALRDTSRALLQLRDAIVEAGGHVLAPCLHQGRCPALDDERDWCHAERPWTPGPLVQAIAEAVGVRYDVAKMTYLVVGRDGPTYADDTYRIVSEPLHTKGRLRYYGCGPAGRRALVMKERDARDQAADFANCARGDVIRIGETVVKGDGDMIKKGERAQRLAAAGEPWTAIEESH